jgi:hypothetical protein
MTTTKFEPTIALKPGDIVRLKGSAVGPSWSYPRMVIEQLVQQGSMVNVAFFNSVDGCLYHEAVCVEAIELAKEEEDDV